MSEILEFLASRSVGAGCLYALALIWLAAIAIHYGFRLINRFLRTIKVALRGWPPEHLDADGDFREQEETTE